MKAKLLTDFQVCISEPCVVLPSYRNQLNDLTSQLICTANQFTGFYMRETLALNGLNSSKFYAM